MVHPFLRLSAVGVPQSTHRARFPRPPLKFRASGFPTTRLQVTLRLMPARAPSLLVTAESPLCVGLRVRRWRSRSAGQMRPHIPRHRRGLHRTTGAASSYSVAGALCPRRCPLPHHGSPTGPFLGCGCIVRSFLGTTARSARLAPTDRLRVLAYTVRPAVRGRSQRGTSPSQLCVVRLVAVPLPIHRRGPRVRLPVSSPVIPAFAVTCPARPPLHPDPHFCRGERYDAAAFA